MWNANNFYGVTDVYLAETWRLQDGMFVREGYVVEAAGHDTVQRDQPSWKMMPKGLDKMRLHFVPTIGGQVTRDAIHAYQQHDNESYVVQNAKEFRYVHLKNVL